MEERNNDDEARRFQRDPFNWLCECFRDSQLRLEHMDSVLNRVPITNEIAYDVKIGVRSLVNEEFHKFYPEIVISYSTGHRDDVDVNNSGPGLMVAAALIHHLFDKGCPCYSDIMTLVGRNWEEYMFRVDRAKIMVAMVTRTFCRSVNCMQEVAEAVDHGVQLVPVRCDETSENGVDITRDREAMWPDEELHKYLGSKNNHWTLLGELKLQRRKAVNKLASISSVPEHGTIVNQPNAVNELVSQILALLRCSDSSSPIAVSTGLREDVSRMLDRRGAYATTGETIDDQQHGQEQMQIAAAVTGGARAVVDEQVIAPAIEDGVIGITQAEEAATRKKKKRRCIAVSALVFASVAITVAITLAIAFPFSSNDEPSNDRNSSPTITPSREGNSEPLRNGTWNQVGQDLRGKATGDSFGRSVSLSRDGAVMAVGAQQTHLHPGFVSVFRYNNQSQSWMPVGQDLIGEAIFDYFGWSVSLNGDGTKLAVGGHLNEHGGFNAGHVRVYEYKNTKWSQLGRDIDGQASDDWFGYSLALSDVGDVLAVGARLDDTENGRDSGSVRLFRYNRGTTSWEPLGQLLTGPAAHTEFGFSVSVSSSGTILAVGALWNDSGFAGQVSTFQYNSSASTWVPLGTPINGQTGSLSLFGLSVSLDASGLVMAVGAPGFSFAVSERVFVFEFNSTTSDWMQRGQTLVYEGRDNGFGESVSLSDDGNVLAVGIPRSNAAGLRESGQVRIYEYEASTMVWNQIGENLNGVAVFDFFGSSVSLSSGGRVVCVGAHGLNDTGYAKVFTST